MVCVVALSVADRGFEHYRIKPETMKLVFVVSSQSTQHKEKEQILVGSESG
jgi:hypothetical protein